MSGTANGDDLALLITSFVEEVKPFFSGIRRGVNGIFAMPRDTQAIGAACGSLVTLAGSAKVLDIPAAWQLAELAQLLTEGFQAAERGGVPDESRAPMLQMVEHLEAQLDGLENGDDRGRERLDHSYRLLEQVLQTVEEAESAPAPALEIALDDLLLTLQPPPTAEPEPVAEVEVEVEVEYSPEPTQIELQLVAEDAVAPIEWGEKEAILWNKGGWDESQTAYGNTEWIFLDDEEIATVAAQRQNHAEPGSDNLIELAVTAPLGATGQLAAVEPVSGDDVVLSSAQADTAGAVAAPDLGATGALTDDVTAAAEGASSPERGTTGALPHIGDDTAMIEAMGVGATGSLVEFTAPPDAIEAGTTGSLAGLAPANNAMGFAEVGATGALPEMPLDTPAPPPAPAELTSDPVEPIPAAVSAGAAAADEGDLFGASDAPSGMALDAEALEEAVLLALSPADLAAYMDLDEGEQATFLQSRMSEMADFATDHGIAVDHVAIAARDTGDLSALLSAPVSPTGDLPATARANGHGAPPVTTDALIAPVAISPPKRRAARHAALPSHGAGTDRLLATENTLSPSADEPGSLGAADGAAPVSSAAIAQTNDEVLNLVHAADEATPGTVTSESPGLEEQSAPVDDVLLTEYRPADHGTGSLFTGALGTDDLLRTSDDADRLPPDTSELLSTSAMEPEEEEVGFLDALLDDESDGTPPQHRLVEASDELFDDLDDDLDPNFAALPEISPEIEEAFARLSEADINTFLTLDGDAALEFLQGRTNSAVAATDAPEAVAPLTSMVPEGPQSIAQIDAAEVASAESTELSNFGLDQEILEVFLQEAQELLTEWGTTARQLRRAPADAVVTADLRRVAHTLKGAANMMGFTGLGAAAWRVEHLLDLLDERGLTAAGPVLDFIDRTYLLVGWMSADAAADPQLFAEEGAALEAIYRRLAAEIEAGSLAIARRDDDFGMGYDAPTYAATNTQPDGSDAGTIDELVDGELLEIFVQEAEDHLGAFNRALVALDRHPADSTQIAEAKRVVHTLKGASAALGYPVTAALCHSIEDLFGVLDDTGREPSREMLTLFFESAEALEALVAGITAGRGEEAARADALRARYASFLGAAMPERGDDHVVQTPAPEEPFRAENAPRSVRVDIAHLDNLLNLVGELVINRTSQEQHLERLGRTSSELALSVERLRRVGAQLENRYEVAELLRGESPRGSSQTDRQQSPTRPHLTLVGPDAGDNARAYDEFDSLEMDRYTELHRISRELVEIAADINTAGNEFNGLYDSFDQTLSRQGRIATDLQDRMMEVRLVPLSTLTARLYRAVRGVATRRGRATELLIEGETVEIDKVLLEEITDPLLHLVRNAADHGIESPELRRQRGKPESGTIRLMAAREGNEAVIRVQDDGAGIDLEQVLDKALARGIIRRRDGLTREQILDLIFLPGFSTSPTISDISGRGVGLDVVRTNVTRLKGSLDVDSTLGVGTTFTIRLPIMLAVTRALLVRSGAQTFAIPLPVVEQVAFFRKELVSTVGGNELFDLGGETYPVLYLNRALDLGGDTELSSGARALIVGNADRRMALVVDELVGQQEVVVKRLGRHLQSVAGVAGATILGSGQVVLILNILDLIGARRNVRSGSVPHIAPAPITPTVWPQSGNAGRVAMVVDDSLSVRRVLTRTLERDGWQVLGAKDGVEALEMLAWARPQVLILDIEMPRMDGYELTSLLRNHPDHQALPIAMLTSRAGEKHRRKAFDLGVSSYLVKPFEEAELLRTVRDLSTAARRQTVG
ncbi:MAG TPA: Hpt domain-containing protein [Thermomicrobiales bacterium]